MAGSGAPRRTGAPPAKSATSSRPQRTRPSLSRTQSLAMSSSIYGRSRPPSATPPTSTPTDPSRLRSPLAQAGAKRKQRESDVATGEETSIRVVVRCRGRSDREVRENSGVVLSTDGVRGKSVELSMGPSALSNKTYHFDNVFSPAADQNMIYDDVVKPMLDEMLTGYNCTIFAYGQTGTGKTYTMSGDMSDSLGLVSDSAGIIPRVLHSLFNKLEADDAESSVKCSFIELYNEELRDLLSVEESAKLKIYEDNNSNKKGHNATMVQGMEESHIKNAVEGVKLLGEGSHKRQVAATKCNDLSSRSHTVFTVTVYIKRTSEDGEEFVSAGKLNLVDLAGSENIQRSGAENKRAAEAGLINKSLLTLGRVINALVDRSTHIPYRESKLTRLLQDSLGGRTKTCIIATVSPAKSNLEETISTLDYAFRAKNIRNKPQINQMISKKTLLREFTEEIQKLKSELIATRQRNGVYLAAENYEQIIGESESRRILSEEQRTKLEMMENNLRNKVHELFSLTNTFTALKKDNEGTKTILDNTKGVLEETEMVLAKTKAHLAEETMLKEAHQETERTLNAIGSQLLSTIDKTVSDVGGLHSKIERTQDLHAQNKSTWHSSQAYLSSVTETIESKLDDIHARQTDMTTALSAKMHLFVQEELGKLETSQKFLQEKVTSFEGSEAEVCQQTSKSKDDMNQVLEEIKVLREDVKRKVGEGLEGLSAAAARISAEVINELGGFHAQLHTSYSSLGRDSKNVFEDMVKHLNKQKAEANELRQELSEASAAAAQANEAASLRLESVLAEERQQASLDRTELLLQIGALVTASGEAQSARFASRIGTIQTEISASQTTFGVAQTKYDRAMDVWTQKEDSLVDEVVKSRDTLKAKLKKDWTDADAHNSSIQTTTKSIHEETVRIVDAQMKDVGVQMQALDEFVSRARGHNERHHETHVASLQSLGTTVRQSYSGVGAQFDTTYNRLRELGEDMTIRSEELGTSLDPLNTEVRQPLVKLRDDITGTTLQEDGPTGTTPPKTKYQYPTNLPRTETRKATKLPGSPIGSADFAESTNKRMVFTDVEDEVVLLQPVEADKISNGLREVPVNVNMTRATSNDSTTSQSSANDEALPPVKRQKRAGTRQQHKFNGKTSVIRAGGDENKDGTRLMSVHQ